MRILILLLISCLISCTENSETDLASTNSASPEQYVLVGTYTKEEGHVDGKGKGLLALNASLEEVAVASLINPTFIDTHGPFIFTANETGSDVDSAGSVSSLMLKNGEFEEVSTVSSGGLYPCHIAVSPDRTLAVTVNYAGGVAVFRINDGVLSPAIQTFYYEGGSDHPRQDGSHPHSSLFSNDGKFLYVADLGTDRIMTYAVSTEGLQPIGEGFVALERYAGPRHMVMHENSRWLYVVNELNSTISRLEIQDGHLVLRESVSTLPEKYEGTNSCADIHINGSMLYASNRGHNSIAIFRIEEGGELTIAGHEDVRGDHPRNFMIEAQQLWVANQNTDNINVFDIQEDGLLSFNKELKINTPVCLKVFSGN